MWIAHVCRTGWPVVGGMETLIHGLARAQAAAGHEVHVVTLQHALDDGRWLPDVDHDGVRYRRLARVGPRRYPFAWGLARAVRGADLVHAHGLDGLVDRLARASDRPPLGISTHGGYLHGRRQWNLKQALLRTVTRETFRRAGAVWYTSEIDRVAFCPAGVPGEVVTNGVDVVPFLATERAPVPGRWVVVGRLDQHKGLDRLLAVVPHLGPTIHLTLVGPDAGRGTLAGLEAQRARLGVEDRVSFATETGADVVREAFRTAELALFPSRHEAFGIAVVEAMAAGCPVAVSGIDAHRALVDHGRTGFHVDFANPRSAADELDAIRSLDLSRVGAAAREAARAHGWDRRLADWDRAYEALLAGAPR